MQVAPSIHRIGSSSLVNSYLVDDGDSVTIVDAGMGGYWAQLPSELDTMGRTLDDVRAVILTHGHSDHIGFAERLRRERQVGVRVHEDDAALTRGLVPNPARGLGPVRPGPLVRFLWFSVSHGGLRDQRPEEVITFDDGATLDVPGAPRVTHVPGHTPGSVAFHLPTVDALFVGDALATVAVTTGRTGPMIAPFTADPATALASLARIESIEAGLVLPGHGDALTSGVAEAVRRIRDSAVAAAGT